MPCRITAAFVLISTLFVSACEVPDAGDFYQADPIPVTMILGETESHIIDTDERCVPRFGVQYFEDILQEQLINIAGASCEPGILVHVQISLADGNVWEEEAETMNGENGYFTITIQRPDSPNGITAADKPEVCVAFGDDEYICQNKDEEIPWSWSEK